MTERRLGVIMNGVTGRMGMNQHLARSVMAIRQEGGVQLADGTRVIPDPILVGRNAEKLRKLAIDHGVERWTTDLDEESPRRKETRLLRKTCRDLARTSARPVSGSQESGSSARCRPGQALAAGAAEDQGAARCRFLRENTLGPGRVRLLGVRGRRAAGAAALLELPQEGRRRNHPRHAVPLALRARQPVRGSEERFLPRRAAYRDPLG